MGTWEVSTTIGSVGEKKEVAQTQKDEDTNGRNTDTQSSRVEQQRGYVSEERGTGDD